MSGFWSLTHRGLTATFNSSLSLTMRWKEYVCEDALLATPGIKKRHRNCVISENTGNEETNVIWL